MADADEGRGGGGDPRLEVLCQYCLKTLKVKLLMIIKFKAISPSVLSFIAVYICTSVYQLPRSS